MKKQIKDCTEEEIDNNITNPKILQMLGLYTLWQDTPPTTFLEMYNMCKSLVEVLEEEIELEEK